MCQAFSCLVMPDCEVKWEFEIDSHTTLCEKFGLRDDTADKAELKFARVEISSANLSYLKPDKWVLTIDESIKPVWWTDEHAKAAFKAHKQWLRKFRRYLQPKAIVGPFTIKPPARITRKHLALLKEWASVWDSVRDSVGTSVWASVRDSVGAYTGSFFKLPRKAWKYTGNIKTKSYPFQSAVDLWEAGLVPSYDGKVWRLHGGKKAEILWEGKL